MKINTNLLGRMVVAYYEDTQYIKRKKEIEQIEDILLSIIQNWYDIGDRSEDTRIMNQAFDMQKNLRLDKGYHLG